MKYIQYILFLLCVGFASCFNQVKKSNSVKESNKKTRFNYYIPITGKEDTIDIIHINWAAIDRPNFIKRSDYIKFDTLPEKSNSDSLLKYCFFLDTQIDSIQKFDKKTATKLENGGFLKVYGKFYKTDRFDDSFPFKSWQAETFKRDKTGFTVFVYTKYDIAKQ
ncbi:MAG: hypothetical protein WBP45_07280 [Daejeonella sp.]